MGRGFGEGERGAGEYRIRPVEALLTNTLKMEMIFHRSGDPENSRSCRGGTEGHKGATRKVDAGKGGNEQKGKKNHPELASEPFRKREPEKERLLQKRRADKKNEK